MSNNDDNDEATMSRTVNKHKSVVKKRFGRFSVLIGFELDFGFNTNHMKKRIHPTFITLNSAPNMDG